MLACGAGPSSLVARDGSVGQDVVKLDAQDVSADLPRARRVIHVVHTPGLLTEQWLAAQVAAQGRYASSLWSYTGGPASYQWPTRPDRVARGQDALSKIARRLDLRAHNVGVGAIAAIRSRLVGPISADLCHAHFGTLAVSWAPVARRKRVPMVVSFYGQDASALRFRRPPWSGWYEQLFQSSAAFLVEGPALARRLVDLGCDPAKVEIVRLPVAAAIELGEGSASSPTYAAAMGGRLLAKKGFDIGVRAFATAFPTGLERLLIIGEGPEGASLRALVAALGLGDRVTFQPSAPPAEFVAHLRQGCVVLFPSVTAPDGDGEGGAPMVLPLAQACGIRVIVSDHDDLPFAAAPGTPVVPMGNSDELARALAAVVDQVRGDDPAHQEALLAARRFVATEHDPQRLLSAREAVYDRAVSSA
jgi:colanic acid/amylovoran biosynthesis glycosyltransferase